MATVFWDSKGIILIDYKPAGFWLCWGLTTRQPLRVILCRLPEKGRKEIEERVEEMKRGTGKKEEQEWKWRNRRNKNIPPLTLPTTRIAGLAQL